MLSYCLLLFTACLTITWIATTHINALLHSIILFLWSINMYALNLNCMIFTVFLHRYFWHTLLKYFLYFQWTIVHNWNKELSVYTHAIRSHYQTYFRSQHRHYNHMPYQLAWVMTLPYISQCLWRLCNSKLFFCLNVRMDVMAMSGFPRVSCWVSVIIRYFLIFSIPISFAINVPFYCLLRSRVASIAVIFLWYRCWMLSWVHFIFNGFPSNISGLVPPESLNILISCSQHL